MHFANGLLASAKGRSSIRWTSRTPRKRRDRARQEGREARARQESDVDRRDSWMQSGEEVGIYAKAQPLFAKFTKLETSIAKPLEGYFLVFFANISMQSLFAKPLEMLLSAHRSLLPQRRIARLDRTSSRDRPSLRASP